MCPPFWSSNFWIFPVIMMLLMVGCMFFMYRRMGGMRMGGMCDRGQDRDGPVRETPLKAAKLRYAKGEITKQQFEELKQDLTS